MFEKFETIPEPKGRKRLHCNECKRKTIHSLEAQCKGVWEDRDFSGGTVYSIYRCGACDEVCFESSAWDSESWDHDADGEPYYVRKELQYPPPSSASFSFNVEHVPYELEEVIEEMMYALAGAKLNLATVGLRMVIEFIVKDKNCPGRNLKAKINALHEQGLVDERQKGLLQKIRIRGNAGVHESTPMSRAELLAGMGIVELLLERFYNGPGREAARVQQAEAAFKEVVVKDDDPL